MTPREENSVVIELDSGTLNSEKSMVETGEANPVGLKLMKAPKAGATNVAQAQSEINF